MYILFTTNEEFRRLTDRGDTRNVLISKFTADFYSTHVHFVSPISWFKGTYFSVHITMDRTVHIAPSPYIRHTNTSYFVSYIHTRYPLPRSYTCGNIRFVGQLV